MNILRIGIFSTSLLLATFCQALSKTEWQTAGATMVGTFGGLHPAGELWAPTFQDLPAKAVLQVPPFPLNQNISATDGDATVVNFYEIWRHLPLGLRNSLQRIGTVEERGGVIKFLKPLKIAYSFHSIPSLPKKLAFATIDPKLPKSYLLAYQPGENIAYVQCVCPFDEDGSALHCRRFPGGYLLRSKTRDVANDPFYAFDITGEPSLISTLSFLFVSPEARTKVLSFSLFIPIFVDSAIALDARTLDYLCQRTTCSPTSGYGDAGIKDTLAFHKKVFPDLFPSLSYNPDLTKMLDACCFGSLLDLEVLLSILRNLPTSRLFIADKNVRSRCGSSLKVTLTEEGVVPLIDVGALRRENQRSVNGGILDAVCRDAEKYNLFAKALWKHVLDEIVTSEISINTSQPPFSIEYAETGYLLDDDNEADKHLIDTTTQNDCAQLSILSLTQNASERNYFGPQYIILPETAQNISAANRIKMQHLIACLYQHHHDRIAITADSKYIANFLKNAKQKSDVAYRPVVDLRQLDRYRIAEDTNDGKFSCDAVLSLVPDELKSLSPLAFKNRFAKILLRGMQVLLSPIQDGRLGLINMAIPENIIIADEGHELQVAAGSLNSLNAAFENYFHAHFAADQVADREDKSPSCYAYAVLKSLSDYLGEWNNCYEIFLKRIRDDPLMESGPSPMGLFCNRPGVYYVVSRLQQLMDFCAAEREMSRIQDTLDRLARAFQVLAISLQACEVGRFEGVTTLLAILASGDSSFQSLLLKDEVDVLMHMSIEARFNYVSSKVPVGLRMFPGFAPHAKLSFRRALGRMYGVTAAEDPHSGDMVFFGAILLSARKQGVPTSFRPEKEHGDMFYYDNLTAEAKRNCQQLIRLIMEPGAVMRTFVENALSHSAAQRFLREKHRLPDAQISILLRSPDTKRQVIADMLKEYGYLMEKH